MFVIIRKHKYCRLATSTPQFSRRLYKSLLDHRLAALIRIFFGDYASSFTSAYFSSLSYSWKRAEFSLLFPCHSSPLLYLLPNRPCAVPPSTHHFHSSACFLLFYQPDILTKVLEFVEQDAIRTQKVNKMLTDCRCLNVSHKQIDIDKIRSSRFVFTFKYACLNL